jgi:hypothetical protein
MSTVDMAPGVRSYEVGYGCQADVETELRSDLAIRESIAVTVNDGVVR